MEDMTNRIEKLIADAAECELIANLAVDLDKREAFRNLSNQYRAMADALRAVINRRGD
jgi:hypothetical protein